MLDSRDFYKIIYGWCIKDYIENGVRYVKIYIKNTQSFNDELLIQYTNTTKRELVSGQFLFTDLDLALEQIEKEKEAKLSDIDYKIYELQNQKVLIERDYSNIYIEKESN